MLIASTKIANYFSECYVLHKQILKDLGEGEGEADEVGADQNQHEFPWVQAWGILEQILMVDKLASVEAHAEHQSWA